MSSDDKRMGPDWSSTLDIIARELKRQNEECWNAHVEISDPPSEALIDGIIDLVALAKAIDEARDLWR